jgi:glycosyltransferase involved in cell wall biosynthesis
LPPLEAMACGTPVLTSEVSSLPEVVGDAALLIDPMNAGAIADAMARVLGDDGLRRDLIRRGHERVKAFSWERSVRRTHAVYAEVLAETVREPVAAGDRQ